MNYYGACDGNMESHNAVVRLCRMRIWSSRYDPTIWIKEGKTGYYFGQISHENEHESNTLEKYFFSHMVQYW